MVFVESASNKAIAYQWGSLTSPGILEVRADMRGRGIGKCLVEYRIKHAHKKGICILRIQCKPATSIPFWEKMGFTLSNKGTNYAYRILEYQLALPEEGVEVDIKVLSYPKSRQWDENTLPIHETSQKGIMQNDETIYLPKRVCIPSFLDVWNDDVVVEVIINGRSVYADKAKYEEAHRLGIEHTRNGYLIDRIYLNRKNA